MILNLWDATKAVLREEQEKSQINNLTLHLKQLEKELPKKKKSKLGEGKKR